MQIERQVTGPVARVAHDHCMPGNLVPFSEPSNGQRRGKKKVISFTAYIVDFL